MAEAPAPPRAMVVDADEALHGLIEAWLAERGVGVAREAPGRYDLIVVDLPFPRQGRSERLAGLQRAHPHTPIVALSSQFLPGIEAAGAVAQTLGVAGVLPKPLARDALLAAVARLVPRAA
jgi:CheY-like chemotaxis protein